MINSIINCVKASYITQLKEKMRLIAKGYYAEVYADTENVLKLFNNESLDQREEKEQSINALITIEKYRKRLGKRLVFPLCIYKVDDSIVGYLMPYIYGKSFKDALSVLPFEQALELFIKLYEDIAFVKNETIGISMCDVHEDNIIVSDGKLYHIDVDGWYVDSGGPRRSRYGACFADIVNEMPPKYNLYEGKFHSDINVDLLCLIVMLICYITKNKDRTIRFLSYDEMNGYLKYVESLDMPYGFTDMIRRIYENDPNFFDCNLVR